MVRIIVHRFGDVKENYIEEVLEIVNDCYNHIGAYAAEIVDIYIFDKSSTMNMFMAEEKRKLGIETSGFETSFFAAHDAWHGTPRIMVAYDKAFDIPELVRIGGLRHEVAHTVLHGSLEYYSFPMPICLLELERKGVVSREIIRALLYLVSLAVKDFEVTCLLYKNGYVDDQLVYNKYFLEPSEEEREAWKLAENNNIARLLVLASLLKTACCAMPLQKDEMYGEEIAESIVRSTNFLPTELSARLLKTLEASTKFGEDTHENVEVFVKKVVEELVIEG